MHYDMDQYKNQHESKYLGDYYVDEERLGREFPNVDAKINTLGLQYLFVNQGDCNLSLLREFYVNWNTYPVKINRGFIRDCGVQFSVEALNDFMGTPICDHADFLDMIERSPCCDIRHTLCG